MSATLICNDTGTCPACLMAIRRQIVGQCSISSSERNRMLKAVFRMSLDRHASGYPDPGEVSMLTYSLRQEKFRIVRERGRDDPAVAEIQRLIDGLKQMEAAARQARPVSVSRLPWYREWASLPGMLLMLFSPVFMTFVVWLPPDRDSVLALGVYALLTQAAESLGQDKFSPHFAAITRAVLATTGAGLLLHYVYATVSIISAS